MAATKTHKLRRWQADQRPWTEDEKAAEWVRVQQRRFMLDLADRLLPTLREIGDGGALGRATGNGEMDAIASMAPFRGDAA